MRDGPFVDQATPEDRRSLVEDALILRDFFYAVNGADLAASLEAFSAVEAPSAASLLALEYEFNKLFNGPQPPKAPPYSSVYLEPEPVLMGESTMQIRRLYAALGLAPPQGGRPDDFIGYELEAWLILNEIIERSQDEAALTARRWLERHLVSWLPLFVGAVEKSEPSPPIMTVMRKLEAWGRALPVDKGMD